MEDNFAVNIVTSWDEAEIVSLYQAGGWWKDEYRAEDIRYLIRGSFAFAVATDTRSGRAIGMGRVISDGVSDGYIQDLVVLPAYRKSGVGRQIVSALVGKCLEAGVTWIGLVAEPDTEKFYTSLGFNRMERHIPLLYRSDP